MDSSRKFVPSFLKKIDRILLLNNPSVWSTRTHLVLFFGVSFAILLALFCMLIFNDVREDNAVGIITGFVVLLSFIGFIFWLIYLLRFNVFKRYGNLIKGDGIRTFLLFFINVLIMVVLPFIPAAVESFMANKQFDSNEMIKDVNEINIGLNKIYYDKLPINFNRQMVTGVVGIYELNENDLSNDTSLVWRSGYENEDAITYEINDSLTINNINKRYINIKDFKDVVANQDSIKIINDSTYIQYDYPDLVYARGYNFSTTDDLKIMGSKEIFNNGVKNYKKSTNDSLAKRVKFLVSKYVLKYDNDYYRNTDVEQEIYYTDYIRRKYNIDEFNNSIGSILRKKYLWDKDWNIMLRGMYYFTLIITLLVFIFRHTTIKTFFLSALSAILLAIITGLLIAFLNVKENWLFTIIVIYFAVFAYLGLSTKALVKRSLIKGIGLNLFLFTIAIMPLVFTGFYFELVNTRNYNYPANLNYFDKELYFFYAEAVGFILLLLLIEPLFKKLYRVWYGASEE